MDIKKWVCLVGFVMIFTFCMSDVAFAFPNPAAVYCKKLGYEYKIVKTLEGEGKGVCVVSPGIEFDAWAFFRGEVGQEYSYCAECGYDTETEVVDKGTYTIKHAVCVSKEPPISTQDISTKKIEKEKIPMLELMEKNGEPLIDEEMYRMPEENLEPQGMLEIEGISEGSLSGSGELIDLPFSFDWRNYNGENWVTPVRDQGNCGSCWAFSAVGAVEARFNIDADNPDLDYDLSEQQLVSCSGAGSCNGGWHDVALSYIRDTGISGESCFPYVAEDVSCSGRCENWQDTAIKITNYHEVGPNTQKLKQALMRYGPLSIAIHSSDLFYDYYEGVYEPSISGFGAAANHAVVLVGWNDYSNTWIIKNSWGAGWGSDGYCSMIYGALEVHDYSYAVDQTVFFRSLYFSSSAYNVNEEGESVTITVRRAQGSQGTVMVDYEINDGTATLEEDYTVDIPISGTFVFTDEGEAEQTFTISIIDDTWLEENETIDLILSNPQPEGEVVLGSLSKAIVNIIDNDGSQLQFSKSTYTVDENEGEAIITVNRTNRTDFIVSVDYSTSDDGTETAAMAYDDYTPVLGTLTFDEGDTEETFIVPIIDEIKIEGDETLDLLLTNAQGNAVLVSPSTVKMRIINDDMNFLDSGINLPGVEYSSLAWGDYNNDGDLDLAVCSWETVRVYENSGNNFTDTSAEFPELSGGGECLAWGDYDNDGYLDLAIRGVSGYTRVYKNNGNNAFDDIGAELAGGEGIFGSVAWGDYDNDGDLDLAAGGIIYKNNGGDTFTDIAANLQGDTSISAWGDYDNDGDLDLAVCGSDFTRIYKNNDGAFKDIGKRLPSMEFGFLAWGDYDNDGDLDLAMCGDEYYSQRTFTKIYKNDGEDTFKDIKAELQRLTFSSLAWGDYDNDGDLDLAVCGSAGAGRMLTNIYKNNGGNTFINDVDMKLPGVCYGSLAWGDYDNDGYLDLAICGDGGNLGPITRIYERNPETKVEIEPNTPPSAPTNLAYEKGSAILKWDVGSDLETPDSGLYYNIRVGTSPGADDIVSGVYGSPLLGNYLRPKLSLEQLGIKLKYLLEGTYYWSVQTIDTGLETSEWSQEDTFVYNPTYIPTIDLTGVSRSSFAWGDYDNDGDLDLAVFGWSKVEQKFIAKVYKSHGGSTFEEIQIWLSSGGISWWEKSSVAWGDYDNDGDLDLAIGSRNGTQICRNNGDDAFDIVTELSGFEYGSLAWGDYDNDGDLDLAVCGSGRTKIYRNNRDEDIFEVGVQLSEVYFSSLAWGDYDSDGDLDLAVCGGDDYLEEAFTRIYRNNGDNTFEVGVELLGVIFGSFAWSDYDNDGDLDLAVCGYSQTDYPEIKEKITNIYRNDGNSIFEDIGAELVGVGQGELAWGDYDNDGDLDLAVCGNTGWRFYEPSDIEPTPFTTIYRNNGGDNFTDIGERLAEVVDGSLTWSDYNNDGYLDLAICGYSAEESGSITRIYAINPEAKSEIEPNTSPSAPINLTYERCGTALKWDAGSDLETPGSGLYYNIRVGTVSGGDGIVSGIYGSPLLGNYLRPKLSLEQLGVRLRNLPSETYYWSVQTIDTSLEASEWSDEETFTIGSLYTVSGEVALEGGSSNTIDVLLSLTCAFTETAYPASDGSYSFTAVGGCSYTITPSLAEYYFFPDSRLYSILDSDQISQDFIGLHETYDLDADGLPDWWEWTHFGEGNLEQGPDDDPDEDNWTNLEEYTHDTDPNDTGSIPLFSISGEVTLKDSGDGYSVVWVKVPEISSQDSTVIYMYYDNPDALDNQDVEDVWDANYLMVQHLQEAPANDEAGHIDSTSNHFDGTPVNFNAPATTDGSGQIDGADVFDKTSGGNGIYIDGSWGSDSILNIYDRNMTVSAWAKWTGTGGVIIARASPNYITYLLGISTGKAYASVYSGDEHHTSYAKKILNPDTWYHIVGVFDRDSNQAHVYIDGVLEGSDIIPDAKSGDRGPTKIGCRNNYNDYKFSGTIDEVRISDIIRSPAWLKACYHSEKDELITFGEEEVLYGSPWNYRRALYIDPTNIDEILTNFPLCIKLDSSRITYTSYSGSDIRFTDALGNPLKYEIENWSGWEASDVPLSLTGPSTETTYPESNGDYIFTDLERDSYILVPSLEGYYFFPDSRLYPILDSNQINQDFIGLHEVYDSDADGLPDWWEWTHFGEGNLEQGPSDDPDGDGYTNLEEYTHGTDPNDPNSFPDLFLDSGMELDNVDFSSIAWGDYDNDGDLDLAIAGISGYKMSTRIYKNTDGVLTLIEEELPGVDFGSIAWGDYDNDSDLDIAISSINVTKIYENTGNDTFEEETSLPGGGWGSVAWGDYDNDGDLDLVLGGGELYNNYYDTEYNHRFFVDTGVDFGGDSYLAWGDYDNDGDLDLAVGRWNTTTVYENNAGTFANINAGMPGIDLGALAWGDYDNDGDLDLAICGESYGGYVTGIYKNTAGSFTDIEAGLTGVVFGSLAWGDYDNDGDLDLVVCGSSEEGTITRLYQNDGNDTFETVVGTRLPGIYGGMIAWGDYNNDGKLDLALSGYDKNENSFTRVYANNGIVSNTPSSPPVNLSYEDVGDNLLLKWDSGFDIETPDTGLYYNIRVGTISGGDDIVSGIYGSPLLGNYLRPKLTFHQLGLRLTNLSAGTYYWSVQTIDTGLEISEWSEERVAVVTGLGVISGAVTLEGGSSAVTDVLLTLTGTSTDTTYPESNGDYIFANLEEGTYTVISYLEEYYFFPSFYSYASFMESQTNQDFIGLHETYDLDADGLPDWWEWTHFGEGNLEQGPNDDLDGDGYTNLEEYTYGTNPNDSNSFPVQFMDSGIDLEGIFGMGSLAWGDYDNDGDLDLAVCGAVGSSYVTGDIAKIYKNEGNGAFTDIEAEIAGVYSGYLAWGDYDNDGDLDLAVSGESYEVGRRTIVYENSGNDTFADIGAGIRGVSDSQIAWGDFDNDGDLDLAICGFTGAYPPDTRVTQVYQNNGGGTFADISAGLPGVSSSPSLAWGDYDNDGDLDLVICGWDGSNYITKIYNNESSNTFTDIGAGIVGVKYGSLAWGDYDNDGDLDLAVSGVAGGLNYVTRIYNNEGGSIFINIEASIPGVQYGSIAWGDYNNDGYLDLAVCGDLVYPSGEITGIYKNNGDDTFTDIEAGLPGVDYSSIAWGDYDNDGDLDLVVGGKSSGGNITKIYNNIEADSLNNNPNIIPLASENLTYEEDGNNVLLMWDPGCDEETPGSGLYYNLRVGTTPGGNEIVSGVYGSPLLGNYLCPILSSSQLGVRLENLVDGTYYWSVQTIDTGLRVSEESAEGMAVLGCPFSWNSPTQSYGDTNGDGWVNTGDWPILRDAWATDYWTHWNNGAGPYDPRADFNRDGSVNTVDWPIFRDNFGQEVLIDGPLGGTWPPEE